MEKFLQYPHLVLPRWPAPSRSVFHSKAAQQVAKRSGVVFKPVFPVVVAPVFYCTLEIKKISIISWLIKFMESIFMAILWI